ncbi:hypothetical protein ACM01_46300 [Streptomyces viridochromogenes]|uniref:Uncharacterized protein n=1 Tax=Streptomyces viridochromogenes TaxID=1938 RepID=A0A0J7YRR2_STRVR|nr:hypothetical protein [Streptomyces viridochromogenes]KMS66172.1 hypothetical protein ACM01_46300 [Streptomyces viridochromogenes]KOG08149.1 hypothetical protein ADK35_42285 [Streptomyces viridochromogenes]KOG09778.1 hypothetical protein ADK36_40065 [Streptomyces viridochromogenes]
MATAVHSPHTFGRDFSEVRVLSTSAGRSATTWWCSWASFQVSSRPVEAVTRASAPKNSSAYRVSSRH